MSFQIRIQINGQRIAIQFGDFAERFLLIFMKFVNQFSKTNRSFNIFTEYCLTLETAKTLYLFAKMSFYLMLNDILFTFVSRSIAD